MGGGGKGGGGYDAGPMLQYGQKALDLQKQIYEEGKGYAQPYYGAGTSGLNELMMRLGLGGGAIAKTEAQIRQELAPSYTTNNAATQNMWVGPDGRIYKGSKIDAVNKYAENIKTSDSRADMYRQQAAGAQSVGNAWQAAHSGDEDAFTQAGWSPFQTGSSVNTSGLDSAVQSQLAQQQAANEAAQQNPLYGSLLSTYTGQDIYNDPSYQFRYNQGQKATERALAATGKYLAPAGAKALQNYGQEMASQEYGNAYNRFTNDQTNIYNRLANIAGLGQTAGGQIAGLGQNYGAQATDLYTGMGNAITSANAAKASSRGSMFNTLLSAGGQIGAAYFSDRALKQNIVPVGTENGYNIYHFQYKNDPKMIIYKGVMADEVLQINPDAVTTLDGNLAVYYDKIGVNFCEVENAT